MNRAILVTLLILMVPSFGLADGQQGVVTTHYLSVGTQRLDGSDPLQVAATAATQYTSVRSTLRLHALSLASSVDTANDVTLDYVVQISDNGVEWETYSTISLEHTATQALRVAPVILPVVPRVRIGLPSHAVHDIQYVRVALIGW